MDPEALRALGRRFWYAWAAALLASLGAVAAALAIIGPDDAWLVGMYALLSVLFVGFAVVSLVLDERLNAAGQVIAAAGLAVVAVGVTRDYSDPLFWGGMGLAVVGSTLGVVADHGERLWSALRG
ncbi:hypothetical protein ACFQMA_16040 [Halosimplex aquaticum]|uniref:SPW repeat-containing protein n=1 Tax=Halosimplex aquaticum TaxID=3026162 RepID=A0ABD5Y6F4_9EURY|nr:hypothetical protein [Halosimplex aquaticum]